ncbi:MAG: dipeptide ABC transporter ATP-binding protein [Candidatus Eiseniibacteriota bacterium]
MTVLAAKNLTLTARIGGRDVEALRDINFTLEAGRVLGLVGESGAGKSMIGRVVAGLLPSIFRVGAGALEFRGTDLVTLPQEQHRALLGKDIAFIPQEPMTALNPVLTIGQQFSEHLKRLGHASERARRAIAAETMSAVRLPDPMALLHRYPHQLSGGMCQRVLTAMAFASDPALLIADEPTTALDVMTQGRIVQLLKQMQETHRTAVLFITHDLRLATQICDDIMVLYAGEPVEYGPAKTVFSEPRHPYTRALQLANPPLSGERRRLVNLPEHMPGLGGFAALKGCRFAPRCPVADPACAAAVPGVTPVGAGHWVRCSPVCATQFEGRLGSELAPPAPSGDGTRKVLLDVDHVSKAFPGGGFFKKRAPTLAVDDVTFQIRAGEFLGVVGESGSGKSTVAKLILGLETPSSGSVLVDGRDTRDTAAISRAARIATVQMVFQDPQSALNPRRMVTSLVTQAMEAGRRSTPWPERLSRARALFGETGLAPDTGTRFPAQLSGGQRQRVNIARALCSAPKVLVADEIVSGLDVSVQAQILNLLLKLRDDLDIALVFISHDLSVVRYLCSHVLVMHRGKVVERGETERVFRAPEHPYTRALVDAVPPDDPNAPWRALQSTAAAAFAD